MEKVLWVKSHMKMLGTREEDGLDEVNQYLENGWRIKHISACALKDYGGQAYIVIEHDEVKI